MKIYSLHGTPWEDHNDGKGLFCRTMGAALLTARAAADADPEVLITVDENEIDKVDKNTVVAMLNHEAWCSKSRTIATFEDGKWRYT